MSVGRMLTTATETKYFKYPTKTARKHFTVMKKTILPLPMLSGEFLASQKQNKNMLKMVSLIA